MVANAKGVGVKQLRVTARPRYLKSVTAGRRKQSILPDTGTSWRFARKNDTFYYDYERIPNREKKGLPPVEELLQRYEKCEARSDQQEILQALVPYLDNDQQYLASYRDCLQTQADGLARACSILQFAADYVNRNPPSPRDHSFYRNLAAVIKLKDWSYLPKNFRRLAEKVKLVADGADVRTVIQLPRKGNNNKKPYDNKRVIAWIVYLRQHGRNYSNAHIYRKVKKMCKLVGEQAPSKSWVEHYCADWKTKFLTGAGRYGSSRRGQDYSGYVPIEGALHAADCWQMDGTRVQLVRHRAEDGKQRSLMMIVVRDVHSGDVIGYHFQYNEDRWGYIHALGMAVKATGHLPYELVHDRFPGYNTTDWQVISERLKHMGVKVTESSKATSKAAAERGFGTMQQIVAPDSQWYYGEGIMSSRDTAHVSPEQLARMEREASKCNWDFSAAWRESARMIEAYRDTKYSDYSRVRAAVDKSPRELYIDSEKDNAIECDDFRRVELFGTETKGTFRNNGKLTITIQKVKYHYQLDPGEQYDVIAKYKHVNVCYDVEDLSRVYIFEPGTDVNRAYLGEVAEERRAKYYGPDAEHEQIARTKAKHKQLKERRTQQLAELMEPAGDVEVLMAATTDKTIVTQAEDAWVDSRIAKSTQPRKQARLGVEEALEVEHEETAEVDLDTVRIPRNYY